MCFGFCFAALCAYSPDGRAVEHCRKTNGEDVFQAGRKRAGWQGKLVLHGCEIARAGSSRNANWNAQKRKTKYQLKFSN